MKRRVFIRTEAQEDVRTAAEWYADRAPGLGRRFREDVRACLARVREHPHAYQLAFGAARRASLHSFPYSVLYLVEEEVIIVVACPHGSRDPAEWERRVPPADADAPGHDS